MQAVLNQIMETSYGPINGPAASLPIPEPDLLDNGKVSDNRRDSQDSFREYAQRHVRTAITNAAASGVGGANIHPRRGTSHYSKRMRRRLVYKNGEVNITQTNIRKRRRRYLADIFTTLVDIKWRYNLLLFALAFTFSWLIFALIWWLVCFSHGDLDHLENQDWKPCVLEIKTFTSALLFSIETQHTIGYGTRHTTEECPEAIVLMMFQSCFGVICQALMTGIVFAKLSRPKKRAETLMFSKSACICKQDGDLCLLLRVGDMRKSQIVEAHIRAVLIKKKITKEGDVLPLFQFDVDLGFDEGRDRLFLVWPVIIVHKIDEDSPFWELSPEDLHREQFELIVILEGIVESTGMTTQARSSYLPGEVLWGHRFERLVTFQKENGQYQIDFSRFHNTIPVDTPNCSAKELAEMTAAGQTPEQTFGGARPEQGDLDDDDDDDDDEEDEEENTSLSAKSDRFLDFLDSDASEEETTFCNRASVTSPVNVGPQWRNFFKVEQFD
ncbi:G protein-activated inward rectifier potassium channel 3 isoform X2 [Aplysia californica]|uniref:G protein-activated inward rectifier potassium channel 3 isoform X2 n=1 Tax=Aplysia californica TaxID=6500 RepID=A0ABM0JPX7_APLCA|nr:G protein-activated inward rectifier potassium channel 3 isoform X2 [Aplysia californica]